MTLHRLGVVQEASATVGKVKLICEIELVAHFALLLTTRLFGGRLYHFLTLADWSYRNEAVLLKASVWQLDRSNDTTAQRLLER